MFAGEVNRRDCRANAGVVVDGAVFDGDVEIYADKDALAFEVQVLDRKLRHFGGFVYQDLRLFGCVLSGARLVSVSVTSWIILTQGKKRSTKPHEIALRKSEGQLQTFRGDV